MRQQKFLEVGQIVFILRVDGKDDLVQETAKVLQVSLLKWLEIIRVGNQRTEWNLQIAVQDLNKLPTSVEYKRDNPDSRRNSDIDGSSIVVKPSWLFDGPGVDASIVWGRKWPSRDRKDVVICSNTVGSP